MTHPHPRILIAGAGVAAFEAVLCLRELMGGQVAIDLLAPNPVLRARAWTVVEPFDLVGPPALDVADFARRHDVRLRPDTLHEVLPERRRVRTGSDDEVGYDVLLVATGARWGSAAPGTISFRGEAGVAALRTLLEERLEDPAQPLTFAAPAAGWTLPAYELALLSADWLRRHGVAAPQVAVATPERAPLELFGPEASAAVAEVLERRGVAVLRERPAEPWPETATVALPVPSGPRVRGLPSDGDGFLRTDRHGALLGVEDVLAAGDATAFPVKQGGLAAQQAAAAAEAIAHRFGAHARPAPFRPVLRGVLLTGGAPLYLRAELPWTQGAPVRVAARRLPGRGDVAEGALWWPPAKLAAGRLSAHLAGAQPAPGRERPLADRARAGAAAPDRDAAYDLALAMAEQDAAEGDYRAALHALDAAAALTGGVLDRELDARRAAWREAVGG